MIKTLFISFLRSAIRNKQLLVINLLSLTTAITLCFIIISFVLIQFSYNEHVTKSANLFRISTKISFEDREENLALTTSFIGPFLKEQFPEVNDFTRLQKSENPVVLTIGETDFTYPVYRCDSNFFTLFSFDFLQGNEKELFRTGREVVISDEFQRKYFPSENTLNSEIQIADETYLVSGVFNKKVTGDFEIDVIINLPEDIDEFEWLSTFLVLDKAEGISVQLSRDMVVPIKEKMEGQFNEEALDISFAVESMDEVHFSQKMYEPFATKNKAMLYVLLVGALVLAFSSCFNYANITFALSLNRAKTIGLHKLFGATGSMVFCQAFLEVMILLIVSMGLSLATIYAMSNFLQELLGLRYSPTYYFSWILLVEFAMGLLTIALISSGILFLFFLRKVNPGNDANVLFRMSSFHKGLVVFQVAISLFIVLITYVILQQSNLINNFDKGMSTGGIITVSFDNADKTLNFESVKSDLSGNGFDQISFCNVNALPGNGSALQLYHLNNAGAEKEFMVREIAVDANYFNVLKIPVIDEIAKSNGQKLSMINQQLLTRQSIDSLGYDRLNNYTIIGVTKDFHLNSLYYPIEPMVFVFDSTKYNTVLLDVSSGWNEEKAAQLKEVWSKFFRSPPDVRFLVSIEENLYRDDVAVGKILLIMSIAIVLISMIGVISLSALIVNRRAKEFAIRKVLGSTSREVSILLVKDLGKLFVVACLLSSPIILLASNYWINRYSVHVSIGPIEMLMIELVIFVVAVLVNWLTIRKRISQNPADVIRES